MSPDQILLHPLRDGHSVYQFTCPACLDPVEKPADRKVAALLVSAGVDLATEDSLLGEALATEPLDGGPMHELIDNSPNGPRVYARRSRGVPFPPDGRGVHRGVPRGAALLAVTPPVAFREQPQLELLKVKADLERGFSKSSSWTAPTAASRSTG